MCAKPNKQYFIHEFWDEENEISLIFRCSSNSGFIQICRHCVCVHGKTVYPGTKIYGFNWTKCYLTRDGYKNM